MTTLHERLAELAEQAPSALPETGLWERGRRYGRVRRAGTVAIVLAAVLALVGIAGVSWQQERAPQPAPAGPTPGLPDRIWSPSPWLDGTSDAGPLGQLAALVPAGRGGLLSTHVGLVGVSAVTGEYRFLDLPDAAYELNVADAALAPDGRHVAYWLTGTPSGSPNPGNGEVPIVGVAIYDTSTGNVVAYRPTVDHGLSPRTLLWADAEHLVVAVGQIQEGAEAPRGTFSETGLGVRIWTLGQPAPVRPAAFTAGNTVSSAGAGFLLRDAGRRTVVVVPAADPGTTATRFRVPRNQDLVVSRSVDATGTRFATVGPGAAPTGLLAGPISDGGAGGPRRAQLVRIPGTDSTVAVLGWSDPGHVVALREIGPGATGMEVARVAVPSGGSEVLIRSTALEGRNSYFATDLLAEPTMPGVEPPSPLDPRLTALLGVLALGGAALGLLWWRRRVRA